jgi:hypothetical protein
MARRIRTWKWLGSRKYSAAVENSMKVPSTPIPAKEVFEKLRGRLKAHGS